MNLDYTRPLITSVQDKGICASTSMSTKSVEGKAGRIVLEVLMIRVMDASKYLSAAYGVTVTAGSSKIQRR